MSQIKIALKVKACIRAIPRRGTSKSSRKFRLYFEGEARNMQILYSTSH